MLMVIDVTKNSQKPEKARVGMLKPCQEWAGILMALIIKLSRRKTARYSPRVLITILMVPRVIILMGKRSSLTIGLMISSNKARMVETLIMSEGMLAKNRLCQIKLLKSRAKIVSNICFSIFLINDVFLRQLLLYSL